LIKRWSGDGWADAVVTHYKDEPGPWQSVTRTVLFDSDAARFQGRYFEIAPGGCTSLERHQHEHFVVVLRGSGRVFLHGEWHDVAPLDAICVHSQEPHQFANPHSEPFGILCVVDRDRDVPVPLAPEAAGAR
jgi:ribulose-bisphosphate carboxylase large chain